MEADKEMEIPLPVSREYFNKRRLSEKQKILKKIRESYEEEHAL